MDRRSSKKRLYPSARRKKRTGQSFAEWREKMKSKRRCLEEISTDKPAETPCVSSVSYQTLKDSTLIGRRIIDIGYFFNRLREIDNHGPFNCSLSNMTIVSEVRKGLRIGIELKCNMCFITEIVWSENPDSDKMPINTAAVSGIMTIGGGYSNLEDILSALDIPSMTSHTFQKEHDRISAAWEETAAKEMHNAAMEEKRLAIEAGEIDADGIPLLTVVADGSWAKRSYRTNYSSLSGAAAIVGFRTKKVLYLGVRNRYCSVCFKASKLKISPKKHRCCKNWSGSSSGMEADIIKEGFQNSISMYGVKYAKLVADGDSNVYKMILDSRPYDELQVEKIECHNHLYRNFCNKLKDIVQDRKSGPIAHRKQLGKNILRMRKAVITATAFYAEYSSKDRAFDLQKCMMNITYHTFGRHDQCIEPFCKKEERKEKDVVDDLRSSGLLFRVMAIMQNLSGHSKSLLFAANNNCVEQFNAIVAKFIGGKRVNFCLRNSYQARCNGAVISHNSRFLMSCVHKNMYNTSPGNCVKSLERKRQRERQQRKGKLQSLRH
ncbi:hypothetical protein AVEN_132412-1 [Araneus ventricosus]|uniref:Mutator-like transposase domain-containing protein n=2 Tax=Araneus ventricosus TaxID=182803 RepID=A0A4Y2WVW5_ARAVE|nr:hypothetical protein AVEN_132412-1 [Araneus ventricosus]